MHPGRGTHIRSGGKVESIARAWDSEHAHLAWNATASEASSVQEVHASFQAIAQVIVPKRGFVAPHARLVWRNERRSLREKRVPSSPPCALAGLATGHQEYEPVGKIFEPTRPCTGPVAALGHDQSCVPAATDYNPLLNRIFSEWCGYRAPPRGRELVCVGCVLSGTDTMAAFL